MPQQLSSGTLYIVAMMVKTGMSFAEIGRIRGVTRQRVHQIYKAACARGIKIARRSHSGSLKGAPQ